MDDRFPIEASVVNETAPLVRAGAGQGTQVSIVNGGQFPSESGGGSSNPSHAVDASSARGRAFLRGISKGGGSVLSVYVQPTDEPPSSEKWISVIGGNSIDSGNILERDRSSGMDASSSMLVCLVLVAVSALAEGVTDNRGVVGFVLVRRILGRRDVSLPTR